MPSLEDFRVGRPGHYPDQAIYAEYACAELGLRFAELDNGSGLVFSVASAAREAIFGGGRCSYYPQNNATASSLAHDKYIANVVLERASVATLGGRAFFVHERHRALRGAGQERADALTYLRQLGGRGFAKPLLGSRGDFARPIDDEAMLACYLEEVAPYYDSVLLQPLVSGREYRIFVLGGDILYSARKSPPALTGDGVRSVGELLAAQALPSRGVSAATAGAELLAVVPGDGERWAIPGRMNLSAGGTMTLEPPESEAAAFGIAKQAVRALGLAVGAVDLFTHVEGGPEAIRVIEVNSNPSIRFLESSGRTDLILAIWRHAFAAMGLL